MYHFANFGKLENLGTQTETGKNLQWLMRNDPEAYQEYLTKSKKLANQNRDLQRLQTTNSPSTPGQRSQQLSNQATRQAQTATLNQLKETQPVKRANSFLGRAGVQARKVGGKVAGIGGAALNAAFILPQIASLMPQKQQPQPQPEDDEYYSY